MWVTCFGMVKLTKLTWVVFNLSVKISLTLAIEATPQERVCHRETLPPQPSPRMITGDPPATCSQGNLEPYLLAKFILN